MSERIARVSPGELYIVGRILNAKYIDYTYVAAIKDVRADFDLFENETTDRLVAMGLLEGDFSGRVVPKDETVSLFTPVFFGTIETTLDICTIADPTRIDTYKFHFFDDQITKVTGIDGGILQIENVGKENLVDMIDTLLVQKLKRNEPTDDEEFSKERVSRFIVAKSNHISKSTLVATFMEMNGRMYKEDETGKVVRLKADEFKEEIAQIMTGVK